MEFPLVGIPLIFVMISVFEMGRGMWNYHTLQEAVKEGTRFSAVRGTDLVSYVPACEASGGNPDSCGASVNGVAHTLASAAVGLPPQTWQATLIAPCQTVTCNPLNSCFGNTTTWPPTSCDSVGAVIEVQGLYQFQSALSMFWPGSKPSAFGSLWFTADSKQAILY